MGWIDIPCIIRFKVKKDLLFSFRAVKSFLAWVYI